MHAVGVALALVVVGAAVSLAAPESGSAAATTTPATTPATMAASTTTAAAATANVLPATSTLGSDVSALPARHPQGEWLPLETPLLSRELIVRVTVNGRPALATLDTGAQGTTMSKPVAEQLGVVRGDTPRGVPVRAIDSHGDVIVGERLSIDELDLGGRRWRNANVTVLGDVPGLFLVGADILRQVDLYIAADEGLVGIFPAGGAPRSADELTVPVRAGETQLVVDAAARGSSLARFPLLVDTGATNTSVPVAAGIRAGLPADVGYASTTIGVAGEQESRGRFVLAPLLLGAAHTPVGRVLAVASSIDRGDGLGLLGNDVFFRFHTIISFRDAALRFRPLVARGAERPRGPLGATCADTTGGSAVPVPCVRVGLSRTSTPAAAEDMPGTCLQIDVGPAYAGTTVELAITAEVPGEIALFNGGAIRAFISVAGDGAHHCFTLWRQLERLGLRPDTPLQLRWVRTEGVRWPCDPMKTRCITFSGPLAQ
jgi:predicted aspartyl protease